MNWGRQLKKVTDLQKFAYVYEMLLCLVVLLLLLMIAKLIESLVIRAYHDGIIINVCMVQTSQ